MSTATATNERGARLDDDGRVDQDLWCVACEYNLRTLEATGSCPECGAAVERTLEAARFGIGDPGWLRHLWRGTGWMIAGLAMAAAWVGLMFNMDMLDAGWAMLFMLAALIASSIAFVLTGFFWVTTVEPDLAERERPLSVRRLARWSLWAVPAGYVLGFVLIGVSTGSGVAEVAVVLVMNAAPLALLGLTLLRAAQVAQRLKQGWLRWGTILVVGLVVAWMCAVGVAVAAGPIWRWGYLVRPAVVLSVIEPVIVMLNWVLVVALPALPIVYWGVLLHARRSFQRA